MKFAAGLFALLSTILIPLTLQASPVFPPVVEDLQAYELDEEVVLTYTFDLVTSASVLIQRSTAVYPTTTTMGFTVYEGTDTFVRDTGLVNGQQYFYSAFGYHPSFGYTTPTLVSATPRAAPEPEGVDFFDPVTSGTLDGGFGNDFAHGVAISPDNKLFVAGYVTTNTLRDGFIGEYSGAAGLTWSLLLDSDPPGLADQFNDVELDSEGNIIVTGYIGGDDEYDRAMITQKYSPQKDLLWSNIAYSGVNNSGEVVKVDPDNNVYVAGYSIGENVNDLYEWYIIKYDDQGTTAAGFPITYSFANSATLQDLAYALGVDANGNFVVGGQIGDLVNNGTDWHVRAYDTSGTFLWEDTISGPGASFDGVRGMYVAPTGEAYVAGYTFNGTDFDTLIVKYAAAAGPKDTAPVLWTQTYPGLPGKSSAAYTVTSGLEGEIIVAGNRFSATNVREALYLRLDAATGTIITDFVPDLPGAAHILDVDSNGRYLGSAGYISGETANDMYFSIDALRLEVIPYWLIR